MSIRERWSANMEKELKIRSNVDNLRVVETTIDEISQTLEISSEAYGKILVATLEAVNNAIVHGNKTSLEKSVEVGFLSLEDNLTIRVKDEGEGFNPGKVPDPTAPENIESINGRGVFLMKNLCDDITFNDLGNEVTMKFKI